MRKTIGVKNEKQMGPRIIRRERRNSSTLKIHYHLLQLCGHSSIYPETPATHDIARGKPIQRPNAHHSERRRAGRRWLRLDSQGRSCCLCDTGNPSICNDIPRTRRTDKDFESRRMQQHGRYPNANRRVEFIGTEYS